jgi:hypothetical protein
VLRCGRKKSLSADPNDETRMRKDEGMPNAKMHQ